MATVVEVSCERHVDGRPLAGRYGNIATCAAVPCARPRARESATRDPWNVEYDTDTSYILLIGVHYEYA